MNYLRKQKKLNKMLTEIANENLILEELEKIKTIDELKDLIKTKRESIWTRTIPLAQGLVDNLNKAGLEFIEEEKRKNANNVCPSIPSINEIC